MEPWMRALIAAAMLLVAMAIAAWMLRDRGPAARRGRLRARFGPMYERALRKTGKSGRPEAGLESSTRRVERLDIRPLSPQDSGRFTAGWRATQTLFLDSPTAAVAEAESLVKQVMRLRGYPLGEFEERA